MIIEARTDGHHDPCIGGGTSQDCERGECNARAMCAAADPGRERYPIGGCVLRDKTRCKLPYATCCTFGRAARWPDDLQETYPGSGIWE